jgi:hypothetical protein
MLTRATEIRKHKETKSTAMTGKSISLHTARQKGKRNQKTMNVVIRLIPYPHHIKKQKENERTRTNKRRTK